MKRLLIMTMVILGISVSLAAQTTAEDFSSKYATLSARVGYAGLGVETLLDKWEKAFPDDAQLLVARSNFYLNKAYSTRVVAKDSKKYLGADPVVSLKDSLGNDIHYFEEAVYDDSLFVLSSGYIDKAIKLYPDRLDLRFNKITALIAYEGDSPDMATQSLIGLIDYDGTSHPKWKYGDEAAEEGLFASGMQEYCASFFSIASPSSYESFRTVSERMLKYQEKESMFLTNLGTYYFVVKGDNKTAMKYYTKVLKAEPDNYTAIKNSVIMAKKDKNVKLEKKYLQMLVKNAMDDMERDSSQARLDYLNSK